MQFTQVPHRKGLAFTRLLKLKSMQNFFTKSLKSPVFRFCAGIAAALATHAPLASSGEVIAAGAGSYSSVLPEGCNPLSGKIYKTADVKGPTVTGQWWSSLLWQEFSANMFAHPLAMVCTPQGLAISYPG